MPQNTVKTIAQTGEGYLWFGTLEGLVRFDGLRFTVFDTQNTPELKNNHINIILKDKSDRLWIGTFGGGLSQFSNDKLVTYTTRDGLASDFVTDLCEDHLGNIWVGTKNKGLARLKNAKFTTFTTKTV